MLAAVTLVLAQAAGANWSSGRPPECSDLLGLEANVWERAKSPELRQYCDLVASASSKLSGTTSMAAAALDAARKAEAVLPGHAASRALEGRALAALGKLPDALEALRDAGRIDLRALDDPAALMAWARVLARTGHADEASSAYRALLPRASALASADRAAAAAEAGLVAMGRGPAGLDEAVSALRESMRQAQDETAVVAALALALALDRRGATDEAQALVADRIRGDPRVWLFTQRAQELLTVAAAERSALLAFAFQNSNGREARVAWQQYLADAPASPWAAHARKRLALLGARGAAAAGPR
jgi:tetratricopeptide (TPR) repeat protein